MFKVLWTTVDHEAIVGSDKPRLEKNYHKLQEARNSYQTSEMYRTRVSGSTVYCTSLNNNRTTLQ